ncbi:hypothetical protein [Terracoccus luteus]|uniref:Uncharacterized protein n=1 Tax=Terracoccus luteus TaxID=53356 RepID=A0A839PXD6_9MICO|nr:hypothetical protein [Terracoccus luteus]MBB2986695.1 hypothetical protein [Terracoccus luteus]MCP2172346.1 hypothetical protein [Terracoccus luteus]
MSDELGERREQRAATDHDERRLREVLGGVDELEPPRDDAFAERAVQRGRALAGRRRRSVFQGVAAAAAVVFLAGGVWAVGRSGADSAAESAAAGVTTQEPALAPATAAPGVGPEGPVASPGARGTGDAQGPDGATSTGAPAAPNTSGSPGVSVAPGPPGAGTDGSTGAPAPSDSPGSVPTALPDPGLTGVAPERDSSLWLPGPLTPQRTAFDSIGTTLVARWPDVFAGAYATDDTNTRVVVTLTRRDAALESFVTGAMPGAGDVTFRVVSHSYATKQAVAQAVEKDAGGLRSQGVVLTGVSIDARTDRVVVAADESRAPGALERTYGADIVSVVPPRLATPPDVKLPDGSTLPTPP